MGDEPEKQYVVVRRVTPVRERGRIQVRTFGPFDKNRAMNVRDRMARRAVFEMWANRAEISVCTLNPEEFPE
jgi:hypothetical protein